MNINNIIKQILKEAKKLYRQRVHRSNPLNELRLLRKDLGIGHKSLRSTTIVEIGDFTYGKPTIRYWDDKTSLKIGKYCSIAEGVTIVLGGEHRVDWISTYPFNVFLNSFSNIDGHPHTKGDVIVGNDVWIGSNAKIMSGVRIGDGCVIAANAVVTKDIPDYCICGGLPAKVIRQRFPDDVIEKLRSIRWWDWPDKDICKVIPILQSGDVAALLDYYENNKKDLGISLA